MLESVKVPAQFEQAFLKAQQYVQQYFSTIVHKPQEATVEISGQRYVLVRAASLSVDLFDRMQERFDQMGTDQAREATMALLFDMAHTIGVMDARAFHKEMEVKDPVDRLSVGPIHFAYTGWAFVDIMSESRPSCDDNYLLIYDHPFSFEADAWIKAGRRPDWPVCIMNAGYSSGWCQESFGLPLVAVEITCRAKGDNACRFIMAPPDQIRSQIHQYLDQHKQVATQVSTYYVPDLDKARHTEQALYLAQIENRKLAALAHLTHSSVIILTPAMRIEWTNQGFTRLTGLEAEKVKGMHLAELVEKVHADPGFMEWINTQIGNGKDHRYQTQWKDTSGRQVWLDCEVQAILDQDGKPTSIILIQTDITEQKLAERRYQQMAAQLESVNKELKEFAYVVSHDLKAPLRGIQTLARWICEDYKEKLDKDAQEQFDLLIRRTECMQALIDGILQYSQVTKTTEPITMVDLNELLVEVVDLISPAEHIEVRIAQDLPTVSAIKTRLSQVFQNLISNAIKYMDKPQGLVEVGWKDDGQDWSFYVRDNGPGIEQRHFQRIFGLFETLAPKDKTDSTGIGLALVKKIVEQHGGKVWVESEVGKGSTFWFTLPKVPVATGAQVPAGCVCT
ncbi:MAG: ATP-binding protein [Sedimentisphaerales bacterium]|nr:ATP-binding protein [Sedimentisphaerales bacterium]